MVLVSRENKRKVYEYLLNEGVIVLKKDWTINEHPEISKVPNLQVHMLLKSLHSKGLVELVFNWQYFYYWVKTEAIKPLREALGIYEEIIVPKTFIRTKKDFVGREERDEEERPRRGGRGFGRGMTRGRKQ